MAIGEDSSVDEPVNRQLHLQAQVSSPHNSVGSASMPTQDQSTCQSLVQILTFMEVTEHTVWTKLTITDYLGYKLLAGKSAF